VKVGDLVRYFDDVGIVLIVHGFNRLTVLWSDGCKTDAWASNIQMELVSESR